MEMARSASGGIGWMNGLGGSHLCYILRIKQVTKASPDPRGGELVRGAAKNLPWA